MYFQAAMNRSGVPTLLDFSDRAPSISQHQRRNSGLPSARSPSARASMMASKAPDRILSTSSQPHEINGYRSWAKS